MTHANSLKNVPVGLAVETAVTRLNCDLHDQIILHETVRRASESGYKIVDLDDPIDDPPEPDGDCQKEEECRNKRFYTSHLIDTLCRNKVCWCPTCLLNVSHGIEMTLCAGLWLEDVSRVNDWGDLTSREDRVLCICVCREAMDMAVAALKKTGKNETSEDLH